MDRFQASSDKLIKDTLNNLREIESKKQVRANQADRHDAADSNRVQRNRHPNRHKHNLGSLASLESLSAVISEFDKTKSIECVYSFSNHELNRSRPRRRDRQLELQRDTLLRAYREKESRLITYPLFIEASRNWILWSLRLSSCSSLVIFSCKMFTLYSKLLMISSFFSSSFSSGESRLASLSPLLLFRRLLGLAELESYPRLTGGRVPALWATARPQIYSQTTSSLGVLALASLFNRRQVERDLPGRLRAEFRWFGTLRRHRLFLVSPFVLLLDVHFYLDSEDPEHMLDR